MFAPSVSYAVCATPRSGSTLLCATLAGTGVAGRPEEYFEALVDSGTRRQPRDYFGADEDASILDLLGDADPRVPDADHLRALAGRTDEEFVAWVLEHGTTRNGVFGTKLMWGYLDDAIVRLGGAPPVDDAARAAALRARFPDLRWVWVRRRDTIRQAISLWRALQTTAWSSAEGAAVEPAFHRGAIERLGAQLREQDASWERFFAANEIEPLTLEYEQIARDHGAAAGRVLDLLGVDAPDELRTPPPLEKQADSASEDWARRFTSSPDAARR